MPKHLTNGELLVQHQLRQAQAFKENIVNQRNIARQAELEANSEYQQRKRMTHEEKARGAIEAHAKCRLERSEMFLQNKSYDQCKAEAIAIGERAFRNKN